MCNSDNVCYEIDMAAWKSGLSGLLQNLTWNIYSYFCNGYFERCLTKFPKTHQCNFKVIHRRKAGVNIDDNNPSETQWKHV